MKILSVISITRDATIVCPRFNTYIDFFFTTVWFGTDGLTHECFFYVILCLGNRNSQTKIKTIYCNTPLFFLKAKKNPLVPSVLYNIKLKINMHVKLVNIN